MAPKRRMRRKSCQSKLRFASEQEAKDSMFGLLRKKKVDGHVNVYKCNFCGGFHYGHTPKIVKKFIEKRQSLMPT